MEAYSQKVRELVLGAYDKEDETAENTHAAARLSSPKSGAFKTEMTKTQGHAALKWEKAESWSTRARLSEGCYRLRSNVPDWSSPDLLQAYTQLTEAETAFRIHKSDLSLRQLWHASTALAEVQKKQRVQAHVLVCFLAYLCTEIVIRVMRFYPPPAAANPDRKQRKG